MRVWQHFIILRDSSNTPACQNVSTFICNNTVKNSSFQENFKNLTKSIPYLYCLLQCRQQIQNFTEILETAFGWCVKMYQIHELIQIFWIQFWFKFSILSVINVIDHANWPKCIATESLLQISSEVNTTKTAIVTWGNTSFTLPYALQLNFIFIDNCCNMIAIHHVDTWILSLLLN